MSQPLRNITIPAEIMQLVPSYLAGTLSSADADAFEEYCILHPEVAAEVERERMLREAMVAFHQSHAASASEPGSTGSGASRKRKATTLPRWGRWLAAAAAVVAVIIGIRVLQAPGSAAGPLLASIADNSAAGRSGTPPRLTLLTLRGRSPVLEVAGTDRVASIELQPDPAAPGTVYELSLEELDASDHWLPLGSLQVAADDRTGDIRLALALSSLHEGRLRLTARPRSSSAQPASAEFLLRRSAGAER